MAITIERVIARLEDAERREQDIWFQQDVRQARIVVALARKGDPEPLIRSSYTIYGLHPDNVWPAILAKRKAKLGREYSEWFDASGMMKPDIPKKKPTIYIDEEAERATRERLAGVLAFPKTVLQFAEMEREKKTGTVIQMPSATQIEARQSLRILPA